MKIENAYIVHIDFDGDISSSKYCWGEWLVFTELKEVEDVVTEALTDLMRHQEEMGRATVIDAIPIANILARKRLLEKFVRNGGSNIGNWKIRIFESGVQNDD